MINELVGFLKVIQELIKSRKPVVGHNLLLDMIQLIRHFIASLPATLKDFKEMLSEFFSRTYINKFIASCVKFKDLQITALNNLYASVQKPPFGNIKAQITNKPDK